MAAEHKNKAGAMYCLRLFEMRGFEPHNGGKLEGIACCLG